jgi:hypothetical protein
VTVLDARGQPVETRWRAFDHFASDDDSRP